MANLYLRGDLGSNEINCMVCDVMATILSWNSVAVPEVSGRAPLVVDWSVTTVTCLFSGHSGRAHFGPGGIGEFV